MADIYYRPKAFRYNLMLIRFLQNISRANQNHTAAHDVDLKNGAIKVFGCMCTCEEIH